MDATIRPASATVLPLSMVSTVGAFLKVGTWMLRRWLVGPPAVTTLYTSWPRGAS